MKLGRTYRGGDRYQFQRWRTKAWRQMRYKPSFIARWIGATMLWCLRGMPMHEIKEAYGESSPFRSETIEHMTRWQVIWAGYRMRRAMVDYDMGYYGTLEELKCKWFA